MADVLPHDKISPGVSHSRGIRNHGTWYSLRSPYRPSLAKPPRRWLRSHVYDEHGTSEFNKVVRHKGCSNVGHMLCHECFECRIGDVPRGDQEELIGHSLYGEGIDK